MTDLRFKLHDIDPETIIGALGKRLRETRSSRIRDPDVDDKNPYYEACFVDLKRLQKAFGLFSGLRSFTVVACNGSDPQPPTRMKDGFSRMLGTCFRELRELECEEAVFPINFVGEWFRNFVLSPASYLFSFLLMFCSVYGSICQCSVADSAVVHLP